MSGPLARGADSALGIAGGDQTGDQSEQTSQGGFGDMALQPRSAIASEKSSCPDASSENPLRSDTPTMGQLEHLVGGDTHDRGQKRGQQGGGGDLIGGEASG